MTRTQALLSALDLATLLTQAGLDGADASGREFASGLLDDILSILRSMRDALVRGFRDALDQLGDAVRPILLGIQTAVLSALSGIGAAVSGIGTRIGQSVDAALAGVGVVLRGAISALDTSLYQALAGLGGVVRGTLDALGVMMRGALDRIDAGVRAVGEAVAGALRGAISGVVVAITGAIEQIADQTRETLRGVFDHLDQLRRSVGDEIARIQQWMHVHVVVPATRGAQSVREMLDGLQRAVQSAISQMLLRALDFLKWVDGLRPYLESGDFVGLGRVLERNLQSSLLGPIYTALRAIIYISTLTAFEISLSFVPAQYQAQKAAIAGAGMENIDVGTAAIAVRLGAATRDDLYRIAARQGIPAAQADLALAATQAIIPPGTIADASLRGLLDEQSARERLMHLGYSPADADVLMALRYSIPPPTDLIRFAVREVFNPALAERLSLFEEYPEDFSRYAQQTGISDEWARRYWAAHWDLPSPSQGYEMLHRGIISREELADLLKALDYAPVWRDKLLAISYAPLTRVDIRRMYKVGVLTRDEVKRAYLDIGYDETNAERLTEFTVRYSAPEDEDEHEQLRRLSRDQYLSAYQRGLVGRETVEQMLTLMRYHPDDIALMLSIAEAKRAAERIVVDAGDVRREMVRTALRAHDGMLIGDDDLRHVLTATGTPEHVADERIALADLAREYDVRAALSERIHDLYVGRLLTDSDTTSILSANGYGQSEIAGLLRLWDVEREVRTRRPERSELVSFYRRGIINGKQLAEELRGLGYHERYVRWYLRSLGASEDEPSGETD